MSAFNYEASDDNGIITQGVIEADSERHVRSLLKAKGLLPLKCSPVQLKDASHQPHNNRSNHSNHSNTKLNNNKQDSHTDSIKQAPTMPLWFKRLNQRSALSTNERTLMIRQLASLLQAGLPQEQALNVLLSQAEHESARSVLGAIRSSVLEGFSLSQALSQQPATFASELVAMVQAGEQSGKLSLVLENWADYLEHRAALKQQVISSLAYPAIVAIVALLMVLGLMTYVVPQIVGVFQNAKAKLPLLTQLMMMVSSFLRSYGLILLVCLVLIGGVIRVVLNRPKPKLAFHAWLLRAPMIGVLIQAAQTERFASTLSILIKGGVPMLTALTAAQRTLNNTLLKEQLNTVIKQVQSGTTLARSITLSQTHYTSKERMANLLTHLIASGEATGRLPDMLTRAAQLQGAILSRKLQTLTTILEPAIILIMGGIVLVIVLSVLLPIIEINQLIK